MKINFSKIFTVITFLFIALILILALRGKPGSPTAVQLSEKQWKENGPFELSPERGRFALTYSLIEDNSFHFSVDVARFAVPDLAYINDQYASRFAPTVSVLAAGGYLLGDIFGLSQVGSYFTVSLIALLNTILIYLISLSLTKNKYASLIAAIVFLFATPAFAYAVTLYQHHLTVLFMLLSIYVLLSKNGFWSYVIIWFLCALSLTIDYPNAMLMFPLGIWCISKMLRIRSKKSSHEVSFNLSNLLTFLAVVIPVSFLLWFNLKSFDNPLQLSGTVGGVRAIDANGKPTAPDFADPENADIYLNPEKQEKTAVGFFQTRNIPNGLYIHLFSPDRGILVYAPIILFGALGMYWALKSQPHFTQYVVTIIGINILLYSMWGDPWGGWAFGSRYLIPTYALMAIFTSVALTKLRKNIIFLFIFFIILIYSVSVNTLGAITSSANPPQVEVLGIEAISGRRERYTFLRNWDFLINSGSKSFVYNTYLGGIVSPLVYFQVLAITISGLSLAYLTSLYLSKEK